MMHLSVSSFELNMAGKNKVEKSYPVNGDPGYLEMKVNVAKSFRGENKLFAGCHEQFILYTHNPSQLAL